MFVFDDVWTDSDRDWEPLKAAFKYGMSGSWIVVTTRKDSVARRMESSYVIPLELLPENMCWLILAQKAFMGRNHLSCENLEDIGKEIAKKCRGLPLAARTLVSLNLRDCLDLQKLAVGIGKLINLNYLCTNDCPRLTYYPKGISTLTSLETLRGIKMRIDQSDGDQLSIGDLENLDLLGGNLSVELIGDALDWNEAKRAKLHKKIHLKRMDVWICSGTIKKEEVLQALKPPSNFPIVLFDYREWFNSNDACIKRLAIKENIRVALMIQKAALQFIAETGPPISAESDEDPTS
ncbi:hypothetical protein V6N11_017182 [Hibiscus sabdariffa]|uniref:NB-ARC domain-containing protein n=1 Tax=Hibiscus sabdariffa TaxID=183260 RepID=A0ABR2TX99_9ROSI